MTDDECIHGIYPVTSCSVCNGNLERERKMARVVRARWPAKYKSLLSCGHFCDIGESIARLASGEIVCEDCTP